MGTPQNHLSAAAHQVPSPRPALALALVHPPALYVCLSSTPVLGRGALPDPRHRAVPCPRPGGPARPPGIQLSPFQVRGGPAVLAGAERAGRCFRRALTHLTRISWMSGTSRRRGSLSVSVARAGEGDFLESTSGRGSGSGLAGREQGCGVLGEHSEAPALLPEGASPARLPRRPALPAQNRRGRLAGPAPDAGSDLRPARRCAVQCGGQGPRRRSAFSRGMFWLPTSTSRESGFRISCLQSYKLKLTRLPQGPCACRELL